MKLPYKISYTHSVKGGSARMFWVKINPKFQYDAGLHAHEYEHVKQWYKMSFMLGVILLGLSAIYSQNLLVLTPLIFTAHGLAYTYITNYRKYCEVKAFKEQLKHSPNDLDYFAKYLSTWYNLSIRLDEAKKLLSE